LGLLRSVPELHFAANGKWEPAYAGRRKQSLLPANTVDANQSMATRAKPNGFMTPDCSGMTDTGCINDAETRSNQ
jgi:hypothetical protein